MSNVSDYKLFRYGDSVFEEEEGKSIACQIN